MNHEGNKREDLGWLQAVLAGEPLAQAAFVDRMRCIPRFLSVRNTRAGKPLQEEELADLAQEAFALLWSRLADFRGEASLETWAYRFCALLYSDRLRRHARQSVAAVVEEQAAEQSSHESLDDGLLHQALAELPQEEREILYAKHFDDLSFQELGERLQVSPNTAKTRYYRGLERLRLRLMQAFQGEAP